MRVFKDNQGREWFVEITVAAVKRVRNLIQVDLIELTEERLIERLIRDPVLLVDVLYAACKPQADEQQISDEDFGRAMAGDALDAACRALLVEIVDFFPNPRDRANLAKVLEATWATIDKATELISHRIEGGMLQQMFDQVLGRAMEELDGLGKPSGSAPGSSASTPGPSPSEN